MITERKYTRKEFYIAFMNERAFAGPVMIASSEGGVNIEEVAEKNPDAIVKFPISINDGLSEAEAKDAAAKLGFPAERQDEVAKVLVNLYQLFLSKDATMVEINPFAEDSTGECKRDKNGEANSPFVSACQFQIFASTPRSDSTTTQTSGKKLSSISVIGRKRIPPKWRRPTTTSTTSLSMVTSVAW